MSQFAGSLLCSPGRDSCGISLTGCVDRFATEEALDEIYRVLKEGAVFGMIWNIDDCELALCPGH